MLIGNIFHKFFIIYYFLFNLLYTAILYFIFLLSRDVVEYYYLHMYSIALTLLLERRWNGYSRQIKRSSWNERASILSVPIQVRVKPSFLQIVMQRYQQTIRVFTAAMTKEREHFRRILWMPRKAYYYQHSASLRFFQRDVGKQTLKNFSKCS